MLDLFGRIDFDLSYDLKSSAGRVDVLVDTLLWSLVFYTRCGLPTRSW
jgi:hypothetical protein